jgi:hypothetical protein
VIAARRRSTILLSLVLVAASCGGGGAATTTTTTTSPTSTTTTTTSTTTTIPEDTGPLAGMPGVPVEDSVFYTGFHTMSYDESGFSLVSDDLLGLEGYPDARLGIGLLDPSLPTTGIASDQKLVVVYATGTGGDTGVAPTDAAIVLYTLGEDGWHAYATIADSAVLEFLKTTTDYQAKEPDVGGVAKTLLTSFDWGAGSAHFTADVLVYDAEDLVTTFFEGSIECTLAGALDCILTSDDGVLRPGDEGDAVQQMQEDLGTLGYYEGPADGVYDDDTESWVRLFQRDYRLGVDGKAGPNTLTLLADLISGDKKIVMASKDGIGDVAIGTAVATALPALIDLLGSPDYTMGWYTGPCDGHQWYEVTWDGFRAIFTDRNGSKQFDGWAVDDFSNLPSWLYFVGGLRPSWTWSNFQAAGATWGADYGYAIWRILDLGYNNGRFVVDPANPPQPNAKIKGFGTGTGGFSDC